MADAIANSADFKAAQEKVQAALVSVTRSSNQLAAEDLGFKKTSNPGVEDRLDDATTRLLSLASSLISSGTATSHSDKDKPAPAPSLEDADDVDVHWSRIVDVLDSLLEKADTTLDEYTGLIKRKGGPVDDSANAPAPKKSKSAPLDQSIRRANIIKPQTTFDLKPDNLDNSPWKPLLTEKPHATIPLDQSLDTFQNDEDQTQFKHPYETEIANLEFPQHAFEAREPIPYQPMEKSAATYVDTFDGVLQMLEELKGAKEIAIDTEHHDFRTYTGLLSLMQISTREKDWIVDTLQPWRHKLSVLNEVFADPSIIKVLHGAYMDIKWLQRDCGLYIVGLFDTYEAAVSLGFPARSLAYLLKRFVDFDADKKYQLADWRIRPIPEEMMYYARSDTHYLLYVYDLLRNELVEKSDRSNPDNDLIQQVLDRSKQTSQRRHEKTVYDAAGGQGPFGWFNMLTKQSSGRLSNEQFAVFRALHQWRDETARREDESPLFILSNAAIFDIARRLPPDAKALHSLLGHNPSHIAKRSVGELFTLVARAKADGANGPSVIDVLRGAAGGGASSSAGMGIGEAARSVFPQLRSADQESASQEIKELVSETSRLWGTVPVSSRWDGSAPTNETAKSLSFALPWARFMENASVGTEQPEEPAATVAPPAQDNTDAVAEADQEFTLKAGRKRKAPPAQEPESPGAGQADDNDTPSRPQPKASLDDDEIGLSSDDGGGGGSEAEARRAKKEAKRQRREAKRAKKEADAATAKEEKRAAKAARRAAKQKSAKPGGEEGESNEEEEGEEGEEEQPFDYTKAKSVLKSAKANGGAAAAAPRFNPYALTAEGPKAARKMHGEKTGRSHTFRR